MKERVLRFVGVLRIVVRNGWKVDRRRCGDIWVGDIWVKAGDLHGIGRMRVRCWGCEDSLVAVTVEAVVGVG